MTFVYIALCYSCWKFIYVQLKGHICLHRPMSSVLKIHICTIKRSHLFTSPYVIRVENSYMYHQKVTFVYIALCHPCWKFIYVQLKGDICLHRPMSSVLKIFNIQKAHKHIDVCKFSLTFDYANSLVEKCS